jgi:hypothetical protein
MIGPATYDYKIYPHNVAVNCLFPLFVTNFLLLSYELQWLMADC